MRDLIIVTLLLLLLIGLVFIATITLLRINPPDHHHEEGHMTTETIPGQAAPLAFIVEPARPPHQPYITLDPAVAERRASKGDIVTPYASKRVPAATEDEL